MRQLQIFLALVALALTSLAARGEAAGRVDTITIHSAAMDKDINSIVILPAQYDYDNSCRYATIYLLHGYDGSYTDWLRHKPSLRNLASKHAMIIVCPDGQDSWYFDSPVDPTMRFETYIATELVAAIDNAYRTDARRDRRAITGLSMGGHGAFWIGARHPELFCAIGSMSGGLDITRHPNSWKIAERLGDYNAHPIRWQEHSALSLVPRLEEGKFQIIFDCGASDFMYDENVAMHRALTARGIDHDFISRLGAHTWQYWCNAIELQLDFFNNTFNNLINNTKR